ncbi:DUF5979 domain-containing protein [Microbacterium sp. SSM24]|uniref:DUF5979 domain-containing protein n=1 Tax=Microbacterium sp. SSM24 TaxID=2991714 RepID=UPI002225EF56|nr:DUF5979 domain-containing protein [Microbacterium sp. SSM24]MCW3492792.1 DUF5979 domain-containing protein [Microbacterium sp. SSM24]
MSSLVRRGTAAALAALLGFAAAVAGAGAAQAAPPYATEATITSMAFAQSTVQSGSLAELQGTWSLPDDPETPAGFVVPLPEGLQGNADAFSLLAPDGVTEMGHCTVTETQIVCDFDAAYLAEHPRGLSGTFDFWARVTTTVTQATEVTYDLDGVSAAITVTPAACPDCVFNGSSNNKRGVYNRDSDTITWTVGIKAPATGMVGGETVTVVDRPGPGIEILPGTIVRHTDQTGRLPVGEVQPIGWRNKPAGEYSVSADNATVTFESQPGYFYRVIYTTRITDGGAAHTYTNDADITIEGQRTVTVTGSTTRTGGGGTGSGDRVGRFDITKDVLWPADPVPGLVFEGSFTVTAPDGAVSSGTFTVGDGSTWTSPSYPEGSIVHLEEFTPTQPAGMDWATPVFSANDFAISASGVTAVTLTNEAVLATGVFSASKVLEGTGADLVPDDAEFTLSYTYPAGEGFPAGSGELTLPADGTVVESDPLPVGAILTLAEVAPEFITGAVWGTPRLSTSTVTIGRDTQVEVTLTNPITATPPVVKTEGQPTLANTGLGMPVAPFAALAVLLGVVGISLLQRTRARNAE